MTQTEPAQLVFIQILFLHFFLKLLFAFLFFLQNTGLGWRSVTPACPQPSFCLPHCPHNSWPAGDVQDKSNNTFKCTVVDFKALVWKRTAAVRRRACGCLKLCRGSEQHFNLQRRAAWWHLCRALQRAACTCSCTCCTPGSAVLIGAVRKDALHQAWRLALWSRWTPSQKHIKHGGDHLTKAVFTKPPLAKQAHVSTEVGKWIAN